MRLKVGFKGTHGQCGPANVIVTQSSWNKNRWWWRLDFIETRSIFMNQSFTFRDHIYFVLGKLLINHNYIRMNVWCETFLFGHIHIGAGAKIRTAQLQETPQPRQQGFKYHENPNLYFTSQLWFVWKKYLIYVRPFWLWINLCLGVDNIVVNNVVQVVKK